jgi:hypothetical protein
LSRKQCANSLGISPVREFECKSRWTMSSNRPRYVGMGPVSSLLLMKID